LLAPAVAETSQWEKGKGDLGTIEARFLDTKHSLSQKILAVVIHRDPKSFFLNFREGFSTGG
jgi:hypothetical protein